MTPVCCGLQARAMGRMTEEAHTEAGSRRGMLELAADLIGDVSTTTHRHDRTHDLRHYAGVLFGQNFPRTTMSERSTSRSMTVPPTQQIKAATVVGNSNDHCQRPASEEFMSRAPGCPNQSPAVLLYATLGAKRGFSMHGPGGTNKTVEAANHRPRFEPHSGWAALPVQPPSGTWQLRLARVYPAFLANIVLIFASASIAALTGYQYFLISILFWILLACGMLQCALYLGTAIRATLLERRERQLGYTTWARKR